MIETVKARKETLLQSPAQASRTADEKFEMSAAARLAGNECRNRDTAMAMLFCSLHKTKSHAARHDRSRDAYSPRNKGEGG